MNTPTQPADELFELELRIAQRADELVRLFGPDPLQALKQWRQAEDEVWSDRIDSTLELADRH
jgi:hypothetical protein